MLELGGTTVTQGCVQLGAGEMVDDNQAVGDFVTINIGAEFDLTGVGIVDRQGVTDPPGNIGHDLATAMETGLGDAQDQLLDFQLTGHMGFGPVQVVALGG